MYALLFIGILLEPYLGRGKFITAYILTGLASSMVSLYWHDNVVSAGASGAIFGMYGVFLAMLTTKLIDKSARQALATSIGVFVLYNLMNGMKPSIDNAAHIGGLVSGIVIGYTFYFSLQEPQNKILRYGTIGMLLLLIISGLVIVYKIIPNDIGLYYKKVELFDTNEKHAQKILSASKNVSQSVMLSAVDSGFFYYKENIRLIEEADELNLSKKNHERNSKLIQYCNLKVHLLGIVAKILKGENKSKYQDSIQSDTYNIEVLRKAVGENE